MIILRGGVNGAQDRPLTLLSPGLAGAGGVEEVDPAWGLSEPREHYPEGDGEYGRALLGGRQGQIRGFYKMSLATAAWRDYRVKEAEQGPLPAFLCSLPPPAPLGIT